MAVSEFGCSGPKKIKVEENVLSKESETILKNLLYFSEVIKTNEKRDAHMTWLTEYAEKMRNGWRESDRKLREAEKQLVLETRRKEEWKIKYLNLLEEKHTAWRSLQTKFDRMPSTETEFTKSPQSTIDSIAYDTASCMTLEMGEAMSVKFERPLEFMKTPTRACNLGPPLSEHPSSIMPVDIDEVTRTPCKPRPMSAVKSTIPQLKKANIIEEWSIEGNYANFPRKCRKSFSAIELNMAPRECDDLQQPKIGILRNRSLTTVNLKDWLRGIKVLKPKHSFEELRRSFFSPDSCDNCSSTICTSIRYKCTECLQIVHSKCAKNLPLPCIPRKFPLLEHRGHLRLVDFCPVEEPRIAYPVVLLVYEIERRKAYLDEHIYRASGNVVKVNKLLKSITSKRAVPNLAKHDANELTGTVKKFLQEIRDPLIPFGSTSQFLEHGASHMRCDALTRAVEDLPVPHKHTLAFLMLHFLHIAHNSEKNSMNIENLSISALGTVFGQRTMTIARQKAMESTLKSLLNLGEAFWRDQVPLYGKAEAASLTSFAASRYDKSSTFSHLQSSVDNVGKARALNTPSRRPF